MSTFKHSGRLTILAIAALGLSATTVQATVGDDAEVVSEWNQILQANIPATAGLFGPRYYAILHIAIFDAVNSIEGDFQRYHVHVPANPAASAEAAAAQAAHDVLVALIPAGQATFDTALRDRLATLHWWRAAQGVAVGKKVARAILEWRTGDGSEQPNIPYLPPALPGLWQPAVPGQIAAFVQFGNVEPFALPTPTLYLPVPPPMLNSSEYATDLNQVKEVGAFNSGTRSADQTLVARLFGGAGYRPAFPFPIWNNVARDVARSRHLSLIETARLFALVGVSINDGVQTSHSNKHVYGLWRPITAIQRAGEDMNDQTTADPGWAPLIPTPPYPSHPSNLTCVGASAAQVLARVFRTDALPFTVTWEGTGGNANVTRSYSSFSQLAEEGAMSRVYGGVHFLFELTAAHESCSKVADFVVDRYMRRRR
jgi:PAP2 superfamily